MPLSADQHRARRERFPDGVFERERKQLESGVLASRVIERLSKGSDRDRQWGLDLAWAIEHFVVRTGELREQRVRHLDSTEGCRLLSFVLLLLGLMQRGKGKRAGEIRIDGPDGFWGHTELRKKTKSPGRPRHGSTHREERELSESELEDLLDAALEDELASLEGRLESEEDLLALFGDETSAGETAGSERPYSTRPKLKRPYCPGRMAGGLAGRCKVSTRTIGFWARFTRVAGFIGCKQPPRAAEDAYLSRRQGDYSYGVWRILRKLPAKIMYRLQLFWGELDIRRHERRSEFERRLEAADDSARWGSRRRKAAARGGGRPPGELERERQRAQRAEQELVRRPV